jgi:hypothetical protein
MLASLSACCYSGQMIHKLVNITLAAALISTVAVIAYADEINLGYYGQRTGKTVIAGDRQTHYNAAGERIGHSVVRGDRIQHYDSLGRKTGYSVVDPDTGEQTDFDRLGVRSGKQVDGVLYDRYGKRTGSVK